MGGLKRKYNWVLGVRLQFKIENEFESVTNTENWFIIVLFISNDRLELNRGNVLATRGGAKLYICK